MSTWRPIHPPAFWRRWLPVWLQAPVKLVFQLSMVGAVLGSGLVFFYFMLAMRFDMAEVAKLPAGTIFHDRKGEEITAPGGAGRKLVKRADIPDFLVKSLQAREDARFFEHSGIDVRGLLRATVRNLKDRDFTQGASTLSMQLARNSFKMRQKSLHRKFLEIVIVALTGFIICQRFEQHGRAVINRRIYESGILVWATPKVNNLCIFFHGILNLS